jgi:lysozyme
MTLIESVREEEGFSGIPYTCTEGFETIGYGTKLPLTEDEAEYILRSRLNTTIDALNREASDIIYKLDPKKKDILYEMAYQIGVYGLMKFKLMWEALSNLDYNNAADEMKDSKWHTQTPNRANRLIERMKGI